MPEALQVIMRWLHISSVVTLIGGVLYGRLVFFPGLGRLAPEVRASLDETAAAAFRPLVYAAVGCLTFSGLYNIFSNPGHSPRYHILLGIKLLLVMHVFAVALLLVRPNNPRRSRMMGLTAISGFVIIAISAYLRRIF
jgi:uncharacterized membrane protein